MTLNDCTVCCMLLFLDALTACRLFIYFILFYLKKNFLYLSVMHRTLSSEWNCYRDGGFTLSSYVTCYHKMSVKLPVCIQRNSLINMSQNNRKKKGKPTQTVDFCWKTRNYTHISFLSLHYEEFEFVIILNSSFCYFMLDLWKRVTYVSVCYVRC